MSPKEPLSDADMDAVAEVAKRIRALPIEHPEMITSDAKAEEMAKSPKAVRLVMRFHGERYDLAQRVMPEAGQGRGVCEGCGHPIYYDDRPHMQRIFPKRLRCIMCCMQTTTKVNQELKDMTSCPPHCEWAKERDG